MDTWTGPPVPWPERPTMRALVDWENGAPFPATWAVYVTWANLDGTMAPVAIDVRSYTTHDDGIRPTAGGLRRVTARGLRDVNVAAVIEQSRGLLLGVQSIREGLAQAVAFRHPEQAPEMEQVRAQAHKTRTALEDQPKPGRPSEVTDEHLQEVAHVYRQAVITGSRKPVRVVAEHFGITDPNDFRPKGWVQAARKRGLIN